MNWLMCLDINFIPQNNFSCKINTMNCKFICQLKKKDVWNGIKQCCISNPISHVFSSFSVKMWFQENIFFKSNIVEHEITKKYHIEQLNMNYNLTAVCFCVLNTLIFSNNIIKAFNHLMTMQQKMSIETLSIEK